jgi:hypothetical protein
MTDIDTSALTNLGGKRKAPKTTRAPWQPLDLATLHPGTYLACDQSLGAAGVVLFEVMQMGSSDVRRYVVHMAETFVGGRTEGYDEVLDSAQMLQLALSIWVNKWVRGTDWGQPILTVHEGIPTGGGRYLKPELSLVSAMAFRTATAGWTRLPSVRYQDHAYLICGKRGEKDKKVHHAALKGYFDQIQGSELITNEAKRDALSVALAAAHRGR